MKIKERYVPTWLRLEHNLGQWEPAEIFDEIQSTLKEVRPSFVGAPGTSATPCQAFCFATHKTQKDVKCSPTRCKFSAKTPDQTPLFHLYALRKQKTKSHGTPDGSPVTKKVSVKGSAKEMPATSVDVKKTGTSRAPRRPIDQSDRILREHTRQDGAQEAPPRGLSPFNSPRSPKMTYVFADPSALLDMFFFDNLGLPGRPSIVTMGVWNRLVSEGIFADSPGERVMFICDESSLMVAFSMARREGRGMLLDVLEREHIPSLVKSGLFQIVPLVAGWASAAPIPQTLSPDISHCLDPYYFAAVWAGNLGKLAPHVYFLTSSGAFLSTYKHYAAPLGHCTMPDFKSVRPVHTSVLNTVLQRHLPEKIVQFAERSTSITTDDIKGVFTSAGLNNALLTAANETWCVFPSVTTSHASQVHSTLARSIDTLSRTVTEYALDPEVFEHVRTVLDDLLDLTVHQSPVNRRAYSCVDAIDMSPHSLGSLMSPVFPDRYSPSI
ncbi:MAG: uncharacterized protein KVP18_001658 [Porospora cf. gigantea A]|nr:MAG: hypothetical protein KVP18_001658 [Porospora cf. gigantea A]